MKKYTYQILLVVLGAAYLSWRISTSILQSNIASTLLALLEVTTFIEVLVISLGAHHLRKSRSTSVENFSAMAIVDARNCTDQHLESSIFSIQQNKAISHTIIVGSKNLEKAVYNAIFVESFKDISKDSFLQSKYVIFLNAGDVLLLDSIELLAGELGDNDCIIARSAYASNEQSNNLDSITIDNVDDIANYIQASRNSLKWSGQTALFSAKAGERMSTSHEDSTFDTNAMYSKNVCVEQGLQATQDHLEQRTAQTRIGFKSLFSKKVSLFEKIRMTSRPMRGARIISLIGICIASLFTDSSPLTSNAVLFLSFGAAWYTLSTFVLRRLTNSSLGYTSRIKHVMQYALVDTLSVFTINIKFVTRVQRFFPQACVLLVASSVSSRWIYELIADIDHSSNTPAYLLSIGILGILLFGNNVITAKQNRANLRRTISLQAISDADTIEIVDISQDSLGFIAPMNLSVDDIVELKITLPSQNQTRTISLNAKISSVSSSELTKRYGAQLVDLSELDALTLKEFCLLTYPQMILRPQSTQIAPQTLTTAYSHRNSWMLWQTNLSTKPLLRAAAIVALFAIAIGNLPPYSNAQAKATSGAASTLSGKVFHDYNLNGTFDLGGIDSASDIGISGIKVDALCNDSEVSITASATSDASGNYTISGVNGKCRIELDTTTLPQGFTSSAIGNDSNTFVQFYNSGTANIMFGISIPADYCQDNPDIAVSCFTRTDPNLEKSTIYTTNWESGNGLVAPESAQADGRVLRTQTGSIYGLAYKSDSKQLFSSAYLKRKANWGSGGIGQIYVTNNPTSATPSTAAFVDLPALGVNVGVDPRNPAKDSTIWVDDIDAVNQVGKVGIGDIIITNDNKTLVAVNMYEKTIVGIDIATKTLKFENLLPSTIGTCPAADIRPMGLGKNSTGDVFIGVVCSGETSQNDANIRGFVIKTSAATAGSMVVVADFKIPTARQSLGTVPPQPIGGTWAGFNPWISNVTNNYIDQNYSYPQAIISSIEFDEFGMIIGIRDRYADQTPASGELAFTNGSRGDTLRACQTNNSGNYVLESNGTCGGRSVPADRKLTRHTNQLNDPAPGVDPNTVRGSWGPDGAEWFSGDDQYDGDHEGSLGAIASVPGFKNLAITQYDPTPYKTKSGSIGFYDSAGIRWVKGSSGEEKSNTIVYTGEDLRSDFMKVSGLGDLEALCDEAPVEIGNRVFEDQNGNGQQDPSDPGISGVKVELVDASGAVVKTTTTNANGEYKFSDINKDTQYIVRINTDELSGYIPTAANIGADSTDSDGVKSGSFVSTTVTPRGAGNNTHTYDFGFTQVYALGNLVFEDKNNNGIYDAGTDSPISNVNVKLLDKNLDEISGKTTTTDENGHYYFAGLTPGKYIVEITPPSGYISSTGTNGLTSGPYEPAPSPNISPKLDSDDNGTKSASLIRSMVLDLGVNTPSGEAQGSSVNTPDSQNDYTVDFGLYKPASLGDKVWLDEDKDGIQDSSENGVGSITVTLYQNSCGAGGIIVGTTTTDANGTYSFNNLVAGNYFVKFTLPNGMEFTQPYAGANTSADSNANESTGCSNSVTLPYGTNDPTIDAGIKTPIVSIDLTIVKTITNRPAAPDTFKPGDIVDYKLEVSNKGPGTALEGYTVSDILPSGLSYVSGSVQANGYSCTNVGQTLTCESDHSLAPNVKESITLKAKIASTFSTPTATLRNIAVVKPNPNDVPETVPESNCIKNEDGTYKDPADRAKCNNVDPEEFPLPIDLVIVKSITNLKSPSFLPGDDVNYKLEITNNGPATAIAGFTVTDVPPAELTYKGAVSGNGYSCAINSKTVVCTSDHPLPINVKDTITFTATISASLGNNTQSIVNVASVKPHPNDPSPETIPYSNCDLDNPGVGNDGKKCNNVDPESFPLPKGASLGDTVWYDLDHDGVQDAGENGVANVTVELHENSCIGTKLSETTTDANGKYLFSNLTPGKSYVVKFVAPNGHVITTQNVGDDAKDSDAATSGCTATVVLSDGEFDSTIDAGIFKPWASLGDFVWLDTDKDGVQDSGENGIANVTVSLLDGNGNAIKSTTTDAQGKYLFSSLEPGDYSVHFVIPGGYSLSPKDNGDNAKDSDADSDGATKKTTLDPGENDLTWDMGVFVTPAKLGDYVWYDDDNDGKQDDNEKPVVGIRVLLYAIECGVGDFIQETTTDDRGLYEFDNLAPGKYTVKFILPNGTSFTLANNVADDTLDSDASTNGCSHVVTLEPGDNDLTIDAGVVKLASLGDFVWFDINRNGLQDSNEVGAQGIHVLLLDKDGKLIDGMEQVTDKDGKYLFTGLLPGTYTVQFVKSSLPVGYQISQTNSGDDDSKDSDGKSSDGVTDSVTLKAGDQNLTLDLGINAIPASLGDTVWEDEDKDGIQDEGEPGIKDITVELYSCGFVNGDLPIATTHTDEKGNYSFTDLEPGSYVVKFITSNGMVITAQYKGGNSSLDSNASLDGTTECVELSPGEEDKTIDAGMHKPTVEVKGKEVTRSLPFTGSQSMQLFTFGLSLLGIGVLLTGFFTTRRKHFRWY